MLEGPYSPQRVTWTHRPGGLWPRAVWAIEECPFRTWLGRGCRGEWPSGGEHDPTDLVSVVKKVCG